MLRLVFLPLLLVFTISIFTITMGQTFQYSRGWTNGKRGWHSNAGAAAADAAPPSLTAHFRRNEERGLRELFETHECERLLNKCLLQIQHLISNQLQVGLSAGGEVGKLAGAGGGINRNNNHRNNNNDNNKNLFANHHQSSELFEDINCSGDSSDYLRH